MYYLIYISTKEPTTDEVEFYEILKQSVRNNERLNITGLLIYHNGSFIQLLEGERENVHKIYKTIKEDKRHTDVIKLISGESNKRYFPKWDMALEVVHEKTFSGIMAFQSLRNTTDFLDGLDNEHSGVRLLRHFYEVNSAPKTD